VGKKLVFFYFQLYKVVDLIGGKPAGSNQVNHYKVNKF
jgi:hypothetical protein